MLYNYITDNLNYVEVEQLRVRRSTKDSVNTLYLI